MSKEYPCVYYDNYKCQKFSDDKYNARCDFGDNCEHQTPSNGDIIRSMSDDDLVKMQNRFGAIYCQQKDPTLCKRTEWINGLSPCEQCYLNWLKKPAKENTWPHLSNE